MVRVTDNLSAIQPVSSVEISLIREAASVIGDEGLRDIFEEMLKAFEGQSRAVEEIKTVLGQIVLHLESSE